MHFIKEICVEHGTFLVLGTWYSLWPCQVVIWLHKSWSWLVQIMACYLFSVKSFITWTNTDLLVIGPLGTNLFEIWMKIQLFSFNKINLKMTPAKCLSFNIYSNRLYQHQDWYNINPTVCMSVCIWMAVLYVHVCILYIYICVWVVVEGMLCMYLVTYKWHNREGGFCWMNSL